MAVQKKPLSNEANIVARVRGTTTLYADQSIEFHPDGEVEKPLYNETLATTKFGSLKQTKKRAVMRVLIDANSKSLKTDFLRKSL